MTTKTIIVTAIAAFLAASPANAALKQAGPEAKKPTVCRTWTELFSKGGKPAAVVCTDRKRPKTLTMWKIVTMPSADGELVLYVVGF